MAIGTMTRTLVHLNQMLMTWGFGHQCSRKLAVTKFMNYICAQLIREKLEMRYFMPFTAEQRRSIMACNYYFSMRLKMTRECSELAYAERVAIRESLSDLLHHWVFFGPGKNMKFLARPKIISGRVYLHRVRLQKVKDTRSRWTM